MSEKTNRRGGGGGEGTERERGREKNASYQSRSQTIVETN